MGSGGCSLKETSPGQTGPAQTQRHLVGTVLACTGAPASGAGAGAGASGALLGLWGGEARREGERRAAGGAGPYLSIHCWYLLSRSTDSGAM